MLSKKLELVTAPHAAFIAVPSYAQQAEKRLSQV